MENLLSKFNRNKFLCQFPKDSQRENCIRMRNLYYPLVSITHKEQSVLALPAIVSVFLLLKRPKLTLIDDEDQHDEHEGRYGPNDHMYQTDLKRAMQLVKIEQDKEIMGLIYEEQRREAERTDLLGSIRAPTMKKDMEEVFRLERQDSQKKIFKRLK